MKIHAILDNLYEREIITNAVKCKKPKMSLHKGRTWDIIGRLDNGIDIYADTTWGFYGYFILDNQWYKFRF